MLVKEHQQINILSIKLKGKGNMSSPIMLVTSDKTTSFVSLNSVAFVGGISWGSITLPYTPLEFTVKHMEEGDYMNYDFVEWLKYEPGDIDDKTGKTSDGTGGRYVLKIDFSNSKFYEKWKALPEANKRHFYGTTKTVTKGLFGVTVGIDENGVKDLIKNGLKEALIAAVKGSIKVGVMPALGVVSNASDFLNLQTSGNGDEILTGMNGRDTFWLNMEEFSDNNNVLVICLGIGAIAQLSGNLVLIGNFPSLKSIVVDIKALETYAKEHPYLAHAKALVELPLISGRLLRYMQSVWKNAIAVTLFPSAAFGLILPGASIQVVGS